MIQEVEMLRAEFDGAQDYDFIFRCIEAVKPEEICHIPKILYHWRCHEDSTAENPKARLMPLKQENVPLKSIIREPGFRQRFSRRISGALPYQIYPGS